MSIVTIEITSDLNGISIATFFRQKISKHISYSTIQKFVRKGKIKYNDKKITQQKILNTGDKISLPEFILKEYQNKQKDTKNTEKYIAQKNVILSNKIINLVKKNIIYQNDEIIIINKPYNVATQGGTGIVVSIDSIVEQLRQIDKLEYRLVHRLDKNTTGILIIAKTYQAAKKYNYLFKTKQIQKYYLAITIGVPKIKQGIIKNLVTAKKYSGVEKMTICKNNETGLLAETQYQVLDYVPNLLSLIQFKPITGRKHQIRLHATHITQGILGDDKYNLMKNLPQEIQKFSKRQYLHAHQIDIPDEKHMIKTDVPLFFRKTLEKFNLIL